MPPRRTDSFASLRSDDPRLQPTYRRTRKDPRPVQLGRTTRESSRVLGERLLSKTQFPSARREHWASTLKQADAERERKRAQVEAEGRSSRSAATAGEAAGSRAGTVQAAAQDKEEKGKPRLAESSAMRIVSVPMKTRPIRGRTGHSLPPPNPAAIAALFPSGVAQNEKRGTDAGKRGARVNAEGTGPVNGRMTEGQAVHVEEDGEPGTMEIRPSGAPPAAQPASAGPPHSTTRTPGAATFRPFIALEPLHILKHASPASPSPSSDPALNPWQRPLLVPRLRVPLAPTHLTSGSGPNSLKLDPYLSARSLVASLDPAQRRVVHELGRVLDGETDPKAGIVAHEVRAEIVRLLAEESRDVLPIVFGESPEETEVAEGGVEQSGEVLEGARKARRAKPRWAFENARAPLRPRKAKASASAKTGPSAPSNEPSSAAAAASSSSTRLLISSSSGAVASSSSVRPPLPSSSGAVASSSSRPPSLPPSSSAAASSSSARPPLPPSLPLPAPRSQAQPAPATPAPRPRLPRPPAPSSGLEVLVTPPTKPLKFRKPPKGASPSKATTGSPAKNAKVTGTKSKRLTKTGIQGEEWLGDDLIPVAPLPGPSADLGLDGTQDLLTSSESTKGRVDGPTQGNLQPRGMELDIAAAAGSANTGATAQVSEDANAVASAPQSQPRGTKRGAARDEEAGPSVKRSRRNAPPTPSTDDGSRRRRAPRSKIMCPRDPTHPAMTDRIGTDELRCTVCKYVCTVDEVGGLKGAWQNWAKLPVIGGSIVDEDLEAVAIDGTGEGSDIGRKEKDAPAAVVDSITTEPIDVEGDDDVDVPGLLIAPTTAPKTPIPTVRALGTAAIIDDEEDELVMARVTPGPVRVPAVKAVAVVAGEGKKAKDGKFKEPAQRAPRRPRLTKKEQAKMLQEGLYAETETDAFEATPNKDDRRKSMAGRLDRLLGPGILDTPDGMNSTPDSTRRVTRGGLTPRTPFTPISRDVTMDEPVDIATPEVDRMLGIKNKDQYIGKVTKELRVGRATVGVGRAAGKSSGAKPRIGGAAKGGRGVNMKKLKEIEKREQAAARKGVDVDDSEHESGSEYEMGSDDDTSTGDSNSSDDNSSDDN